MIAVPEDLATLLLAYGESGREWVSNFRELAEHYLKTWCCELDGQIRNGAVAVVLPVKSPYGPAVIKISHPRPEGTDEHRALRLWRGDGSVELFEHDADGFVLLLERVEDRQLDVAPDEGIIIGGELSARLAIPAPPDMKRLADTTDEWEQQLRDHDQRAQHPLPGRVLSAAVETIRDLGQDRTATMLHGDLHSKNILHSSRDWVVIDPKGMSGTAAYDAVTMFNYRLPPLQAMQDPVVESVRRIALFSDAAGVDPALARRCVQARAVTGLAWDLSRGDVPRSPNFAIRTLLCEGLLR